MVAEFVEEVGGVAVVFVFAVVEFEFGYFSEVAEFPSSHLFQCCFRDAPISAPKGGAYDGGAEPGSEFGGGVVVGSFELSVSPPEYFFGLCLSVVLGGGCVALVVDEFA